MKNIERIFLFLVLPTLAPLIYPPAILADGLPVIVFTVVLFLALGFLLWRGYYNALVLSIFIQGLNVIVRLMMLFPHATSATGAYDWLYIVSALASILLSWLLLNRLESTKVRVQMVR